MPRLTADFYLREDTVQIAKDLLGKILITEFDNQRTTGRIVETEAYKAPDDKACHAYQNRLTNRTKTMFLAGGVAYVYLCYGIHHLFNVVTGPEGAAHAVLIRGLEPLEGEQTMLSRRKLDRIKPQLSAGPGVMSKAMGIKTDHDGTSFLKPESTIWIEDAPALDKEEVLAGPRIGVGYAEECAAWPWRFYQKDSKWVSRPR